MLRADFRAESSIGRAFSPWSSFGLLTQGDALGWYNGAPSVLASFSDWRNTHTRSNDEASPGIPDGQMWHTCCGQEKQILRFAQNHKTLAWRRYWIG